MTRPSFMPAPSLQGTHNFRSLRGVKGAGGILNSHALLRSDHLNHLTATDWLTLSDLGLKVICDLRGLEEREKTPTQVPDGMTVQVINFDIRNDVRNNPELVRSLGINPNPAAMRELMLRIYRSFPEVFAPHLAQWFELFAQTQVPVLVHCAAGKDRTGFMVAALLHAMGVCREDILQDYLRSAPRDGKSDHRIPGLQALFREMLGQDLPPGSIMPILQVEEAYLQAALDEVDRQYGSMDNYLRRVAKVDDVLTARLRKLYLT